MKKKVLATLAALTLVSSVGFASPLTDYSAGKTAIDLNLRSSDVKDNEYSLDKKSNLDWGVTTGLGNKLAIQYNGYNAKSKDTVYTSNAYETNRMNCELKIQEFNVLYKLDRNVSVYTGLVTMKASSLENDNVGGVDIPYPYSSNTKKKMQFGLVGSTKLADKTSAYASVGVASDYTNWKIGVSQEIAPNLELNVDYRRLQAKKMTYDNGGGVADITVKGIGYGITYKF